MRGTITSWMRWSPSSMTAWIICSSSASRIPCSPPCSMIRRSSSALIRSSAATSAPNSRLMRRVVHVRNATSGPKIVPSTSMRRLVENTTRSAWARPICFGTSSPKMIVKIVSSPVTTTSAIRFAAPASGPNVASQAAIPSTRLTAANAEARKPRKLMPIWMTARKRPGCCLSRRTRAAPLVALVDELLEAAAAQRDQRDLGGREDAVEEDEDDDEGEFEVGVGLGDAAGRRRARTTADHERHADEGQRRPPRAGDVSHRHRRSRVWTVARGSGPGHRPPACRPARRG